MVRRLLGVALNGHNTPNLHSSSSTDCPDGLEDFTHNNEWVGFVERAQDADEATYACESSLGIVVAWLPCMRV